MVVPWKDWPAIAAVQISADLVLLPHRIAVWKGLHEGQHHDQRGGMAKSCCRGCVAGALVAEPTDLAARSLECSWELQYDGSSLISH